MGLHILRKREGHRARIGGIGEDAHRFRQRGEQLLRPRDAVEEAADRTEAVCNAYVAGHRILQLLKHGFLMPRERNGPRGEAAPGGG